MKELELICSLSKES